MDTYKTIVSKRDTRSFTDQTISEETLRRILQAGSMGVLPSQALCVETSEQIEEALDYVRNGMHTADAMRGRFMGMRAS